MRQTRAEVVDAVKCRSNAWMGDRAVDCARLESVCAERHRGFESPPIRANLSFVLLLLLLLVFNVSVPALAAPVAVSPCCRPAELHESSPSDKSCSCVQSPNLD